MTQNDWVLDALKRGPVTPMDALKGIGCFRLSARVLDLRRAGHNIQTEYYTTPTGKVVARYHLVQAEEQAA
jgi:hypothetical protein